VLPLGHIFGRPRIRHRARCGCCGGSCCGVEVQKPREINVVACVAGPLGRGHWLIRIAKPPAMDEKPSGRTSNATFLTLSNSALADSDSRYMSKDHTLGLKRWRVAEPCWRRVLHRRSTRGPTDRETSPPRAPSQAKVRYRDIALDARVVGSGLGSCVLIEIDGAPIAR
jgi:hypothetical protein